MSNLRENWRVCTVGAVIGVVMLGLGFAAHATGTTPAPPAPAIVVVHLSNGQDVTCVTVKGSVTCDWAGYRK